MVPYFHLIQLHWVGCHPWSTMPPPYALPFCMWASQAYVNIILIKSRLQIPFHIPTRHHTLSRTTKTTIENFHSLHRSKVSKFHGMRLYARLFKTLEKTTISPIFHIIRFQSILPPKRKKKSSGQFFEKNVFGIFWLSAQVFVVYDPFCGVRWSVSRCVECDGVLWGAMTPLEYDATWVCVAGNPLREGFWATIPQIQQSERMLVVVI